MNTLKRLWKSDAVKVVGMVLAAVAVVTNPLLSAIILAGVGLGFGLAWLTGDLS